MVEKSTTCGWRLGWLAVGMTALGRSIQIHDGRAGPDCTSPIAWLTVAIGAVVLALFVPPLIRVSRRGVLIVISLGLAGNFIQLAMRLPGIYLLPQSAGSVWPYFAAVALAAVSCGFGFFVGRRARACLFAGLLAAVAFMGGWTIVHSPRPHIDVYMFQVDSSAALSSGHNPYDMTFPEIYGPPYWTYGPGVVQNGRLQFGYPYFPETLLAVMPATLLHADVRYAQLAAMLLSAAILVVVRWDIIGFAAAMLLLTTPRLCCMVELSFIEPFCILTLVATIACAQRWPRLLPVTLGLFLASKQYAALAVVLVFVDVRPLRQSIVLVIKAGIVAAIVTLPLAIWNLPAFWRSVVTLQFRQPFRFDSISYLAWAGGASWPNWTHVVIPFVALFLAMVGVFWRRRSVGFAGAVAFCFLLFFAFNKQAFGNYYLFVIGAIAAAMIEPPPRDLSCHEASASA